MFISPMLANKCDESFQDYKYIFEPKMDGHRLILSRTNGETRMWTRNENEVTRKYPELWNVPAAADVILDGEVVRIDPETEQPDFELVMRRFRMNPDQAKKAAVHEPVVYFVFDILQLNGEDLRNRPLLERKRILENTVEDNGHILKVLFVDGRGNDLYDIICRREMEGIVAKKKDSRYISGQSPSWLKVINYQHAEVYIVGYKKDRLGWLAAVEKSGKLQPAGLIELGVPPKHRKAFYTIAQQIMSGEDQNHVYLEPRIRAKLKFRNWTRNGLLRSPVFIDFMT